MNKPISRFGGMRLDSRSTTTRVEEMTARGIPAVKIAHKLKISFSVVREIQAELRGWGMAARPDSSSPTMANHKGHVEAVMAQGGFCALSERLTAKGEPYACLPLVWPRAA